MEASNFISLSGLFLKFISDLIVFIFQEFLKYISFIKNNLILYKNIFILGLFFILIIISLWILWKNKKSFSRFVWWPEPILNGPLLRIFGEFFRNHLTKGLLELEKFLETLTSQVGVIIIIGEKDYNNHVITYYDSDSISWFFINNAVYFYIKDIDDIKFTLSFLNKIRPKQPINSLVIKNNLNENINEDILKSIYMITNFKIPLYIIFENIKWCQYIWEFCEQSDVLGILFNKNEGISIENVKKEINNLKLSILEKMIRNHKYYINFWQDFDEMIDPLIEIISNTSQYNYNFFRGFFFTITEFKIHLESILKVPENTSYFISFYKIIVEKELLLAEPVNSSKFFISRYEKYKNNFIYGGILLVLIIFIKINSNLFIFKKDMKYFFHEYTKLIEKEKVNNLNEKINNLNEKEIMNNGFLYKILCLINEVNLSKVDYKYMPHNYFLKNLYNQLLNIDEILLIKLLKSKDLILNLINDSNEEEDRNSGNNVNESTKHFKKFYNYTNKILDLEKMFSSDKKVLRFGIQTVYKNNNGKDLLLEASEDIQKIYFLLLNNFLNLYFSDDLLNILNEFNQKLNNFFKSNHFTSMDELKEIIIYYHNIQKYIKEQNIKLKLTNLHFLLEKINNSIIFGHEISLKSQNILNTSLENYYFRLINVKNSIIGNLLNVEGNILIFDSKCAIIINDIEKFLQEPFMTNTSNDAPQIPNNNLISNWNLFILKDFLNLQNKSIEFKEKLKTYSKELQIIFFGIFESKIAESIYNQIGISQNFTGLDTFNIKNYMDAFYYLNNTLDFFLETGSIDYYNNLIKIIYHDVNFINEKIEDKIENSIFSSYKKLKNLNKDNIQELICDTDNIKKIQEILNNEVDNLIEIYNFYMKFVIDILSKEHFKAYRGTQYNKYINIGKEILKYNKGLDNSIGEFMKFILDLKDFSIYDSFKKKFVIGEVNNLIDELLNKLKIAIIEESQKLYTKELILNYDNLVKDLHTFKNIFPFSEKFEENSSFINVENLYNILNKYKKIIIIFNNNNYIPENIKININKLKSLLNGIKKDLNGYFYEDAMEYNLNDKFNIHNKYIGLIIINQSPEYSQYFLQKNIKLYFDGPIYLHIEIANINDFKIPEKHPSYFQIAKNRNSITLKFNTIWHFIYYLYTHEESCDNGHITSIISIPVIVGVQHSFIKVAIKLNNFLFFPHHIPKLVINE